MDGLACSTICVHQGRRTSICSYITWCALDLLYLAAVSTTATSETGGETGVMTAPILEEWKLASRPCSLQNSGYRRKRSCASSPNERVLIARHVFVPQPVIFVMVKSGGISLLLLSRCGYTPV